MTPRITALCGCYTDRHDHIQYKCDDHKLNRIFPGYTDARNLPSTEN